MKHLFYVWSVACLFFACQPQNKFTVEGNIQNAADKTLFFEYNAIDKTTTLDSVVLDESGHFRFKTAVPSSPDFYRLRIEKKNITLAVDSSVNIKITSNYEHFHTGYSVEGSLICEEIRCLSQLLRQTLSAYDSLQTLFTQKQLTQEVYIDEVKALIKAHKDQARPYIYENTLSPTAYFVLFQRIHKLMIFNPYDTEDNKLFSAVATAWNVYYPEAMRTKNLTKLTLSGINQIRKEREPLEDIEIHEIDKLSYYEIDLPNIFGQNVPLSSLEGKVVLLDFTAFQTDYSAKRTLALRELYKQFETSNFEIYQVSLDPDEHFWKTGALNLPWICVRDRDCSQSAYARMYNVQKLPAYFLIDKNGHLVGRDETIKDIQAEIIRLLQEK